MISEIGSSCDGSECTEGMDTSGNAKRVHGLGLSVVSDQEDDLSVPSISVDCETHEEIIDFKPRELHLPFTCEPDMRGIFVESAMGVDQSIADAVAQELRCLGVLRTRSSFAGFPKLAARTMQMRRFNTSAPEAADVAISAASAEGVRGSVRAVAGRVRNVVTRLSSASGGALFAAPDVSALSSLCTYAIKRLPSLDHVHAEATNSQWSVVQTRTGVELQSPILEASAGAEGILFLRAYKEIFVGSVAAASAASCSSESLSENPPIQAILHVDVPGTVEGLCASPHIRGEFATLNGSCVHRWNPCASFGTTERSISKPSHSKHAAVTDVFDIRGCLRAATWWSHPEQLMVATRDIGVLDFREGSRRSLFHHHSPRSGLDWFERVDCLARSPWHEHLCAAAVVDPSRALIFDARSLDRPLLSLHLPLGTETIGFRTLAWGQRTLGAGSTRNDSVDDWLAALSIGGRTAAVMSWGRMDARRQDVEAQLKLCVHPASFPSLANSDGLLLGGVVEDISISDGSALALFCFTSKAGLIGYEIVEQKFRPCVQARADVLDSPAAEDDGQANAAECAGSSIEEEDAARAAAAWLAAKPECVAAVLEALGLATRRQTSVPPPALYDRSGLRAARRGTARLWRKVEAKLLKPQTPGELVASRLQPLPFTGQVREEGPEASRLQHLPHAGQVCEDGQEASPLGNRLRTTLRRLGVKMDKNWILGQAKSSNPHVVDAATIFEMAFVAVHAEAAPGPEKAPRDDLINGVRALARALVDVGVLRCACPAAEASSDVVSGRNAWYVEAYAPKIADKRAEVLAPRNTCTSFVDVALLRRTWDGDAAATEVAAGGAASSSSTAAVVVEHVASPTPKSVPTVARKKRKKGF